MLALLHSFNQSSIYIPSKNSAERLLRNKEILQLYKKKKSYKEISEQFSITERWIRNIVKIMIYRSISR